MIKLNQNFPAKLLDNTRIKPAGSLVELTNIYIANRRIKVQLLILKKGIEPVVSSEIS